MTAELRGTTQITGVSSWALYKCMKTIPALTLYRDNGDFLHSSAACSRVYRFQSWGSSPLGNFLLSQGPWALVVEDRTRGYKGLL